MTVGELLHSTKKPDVMAVLFHLYTGSGEDPEGYDRMWDTLLRLQPEPTTTSIYLGRTMSDDDPPEPWVDVSGREPNDPQSWAIEFVDWAQWLSMEIEVDPALANMPDEEKLAHCLYEMTWAGYDREAAACRMEELVESVEEAKAQFETRVKH